MTHDHHALPGVWGSMTNAERADYLRDRPTLPDANWTTETRLPGESRDAFISRVLTPERRGQAS
jgi:hypothetical protein